MLKFTRERWIVEVQTRERQRVSRRYYPTEAEAEAARERGLRQHPVTHKVRVFKMPAAVLPVAV